MKKKNRAIWWDANSGQSFIALPHEPMVLPSDVGDFVDGSNSRVIDGSAAADVEPVVDLSSSAPGGRDGPVGDRVHVR